MTLITNFWSSLSTLLLAALAVVSANGNEPPTRFVMKSVGARIKEDPVYAAKMAKELAIPKSQIGDEVYPLNMMKLMQLTIDVWVGTPRQLVPLVVDNSIPDTWFPSVDCTSDTCTNLRDNAFNQYLSSTYQSTEGPYDVLVGDYSITISYMTGMKAYDEIQIGGVNFTGNFTLCNTTWNPNVLMLMHHGRLGIGFPYPNPSIPSFLPQLFQNKTKKIVSMYFHHLESYGFVGEIQFGDIIDANIHPSTVRVYPNYLPQLGFWGLKLTNVKIGNLALGFNGWMALDIASPFIILPTAVMKTFAAALELDKFGTKMISAQSGAIYYKVKCDRARSMKSVTIQWWGRDYTVTARHYLIGDGIDCVAAFMGQNTGRPFGTAWIMGSIFFEDRMLSFDYDAGTITMADLKV